MARENETTFNHVVCNAYLVNPKIQWRQPRTSRWHLGFVRLTRYNMLSARFGSYTWYYFKTDQLFNNIIAIATYKNANTKKKGRKKKTKIPLWSVGRLARVACSERCTRYNILCLQYNNKIASSGSNDKGGKNPKDPMILLLRCNRNEKKKNLTITLRAEMRILLYVQRL